VFARSISTVLEAPLLIAAKGLRMQCAGQPGIESMCADAKWHVPPLKFLGLQQGHRQRLSAGR
jgi:hypothetical protein